MSGDAVIQFVPPLYMQRYSKVLDILSKERPKKVIDFGCAECKLIQLLKSEDYLEEICGVDIDRSLLDASQRKIEPLTVDYINPRTRPLTLKLIKGSVLTPNPNLVDFDAVTCIELVEHLKPEMLPELQKNIFGYIRPKVVIISTPNADFNVLFSSGKKLRHWDHKFEWTQDEFQNWCRGICTQFNYTVGYDGVGKTPESKHEHGFCSQFAIFRKVDKNCIQSRLNGIMDQIHNFEIVAVSVHPFVSAKVQQETRFFSKFCSFIDSLRSLCKTLLCSNEDDKPTINSLQRTFMHLRLKSSTYIPINFRNTQKKVPLCLTTDQFNDAFEYGSDSCSTNIYGQKRFLVVVEPLKTTFNYLQKLKDKYIKSCDVLPVPGQFEDCETELKYFWSNSRNKHTDVHQTKTVDLAKYDSDFPYTLRVTTASEDEDFGFVENMVLYKSSSVLKVPFSLMIKREEIKTFGLNHVETENVINNRQPEGVELLHKDGNVFLVVDLEISDTVNKDRHWSRDDDSCSSESTFSDRSLDSLKACNDEDFSEENWDSE